MRKLLLLFVLCGTAFGQGVRVDLPPVLNSRGVPIANPNIILCTAAATINGTTCSIQATSFTDITLGTPCAGGSPVTLANSNVCRATGDSLGNAGFWLSAANYIYCVTAPSTTGQCYNLTVGGATGTSITPSQVNTRIYVDGTKYPITQAGVQQAFTDACNATLFPTGNTTVYLPAASITLNNRAIDLLQITCGLSVEGAGGQNGTTFSVAAGISSTIPVIHFLPSGGTNSTSLRIKDVTISAASTTTAGDGLLIDGQNLAANTPIFMDVGPHFSVGTTSSLNGYAVNTTGVNGPAGSSLMWQVHDNALNGGLKLTNIADGFLIRNNAINCSASSTHADIELTVLAGSAEGLITNNWAAPGCAGGALILHSGLQVNIEDNQFEQGFPTTEANSAMIDLMGDVNTLSDVQVRHNNLNSHNNVNNAIRLDHSNNTHIEDNAYNSSLAAGVGILLTANPTNTRFPYNDTGALSGGAVAVSNPSNTSLVGFQMPSGTGMGFASSVPDTIFFQGNGTNPFLMNSAGELRAGSGSLVDWSSAAGPGNGAGDTGLTRVAANVVGVGNGTGANVSGEIRSAKISATYNAAGTVQTAVHLVQDTCTLGTNCGVTLAGSAAFTSATSYTCTCHDQTTPLNACGVNQTGGGALTITGTGTDVIRYMCAGN